MVFNNVVGVNLFILLAWRTSAEVMEYYFPKFCMNL